MPDPDFLTEHVGNQTLRVDDEMLGITPLQRRIYKLTQHDLHAILDELSRTPPLDKIVTNILNRSLDGEGWSTVPALLDAHFGRLKDMLQVATTALTEICQLTETMDVECHDPECGDSSWDHECSKGRRVVPTQAAIRAQSGLVDIHILKSQQPD